MIQYADQKLPAIFPALILALATATASAPVAVQAQPAEEGATELEAIEVTGSRIRRTDYETSQPIAVITRAEIERTGLTSIGDILQKLPVAGAALNTTFNNGGTGATEIDLRNLGSNRVLVLVNGRRWVNGLRSFSTSSVDLNTIPISIIDRVEVLKDGASAVYGTDAIAGVVNIITRRDYQGADLRVYGGQFDEEDGGQQFYSLSLGSISGPTSIFVDLSHRQQFAVFAGDRTMARVPLFGTGNTRGSSASPQGRFLFTPDPAANVSPACLAFVGPTSDFCDLTLIDGEDGQQVSDFRGRSAADAYNYAPINYLQTPLEQTAIFTQIGHQLADNIRLGGELLYNVRKSQQQLAETPLFIGDLSGVPTDVIFIAADNPFNPFGQDIGRPDFNKPNAVFGFVGTAFVGRRMTELGPRIFSQNVDTLRAGLGLDGTLDLWEGNVGHWDVGYTYADSRNAEYFEGLLNMEHVAKALGPIAVCNADPNCVPLNVFGGMGPSGTGSITPQMLDYIAYSGTSTQQQKLRHYYATLSSDVMQLPAGPLGAAVGIEYRVEEFSDIPDPFIVQGISSTNRALPTYGQYTAREGYLELGVPLASGMPGVEALRVSGALRYSDYDRFGSTTTSKFGVEYKPVQEVLVRASVSEAFRAPSITELFLGLSDSFPELGDPCSNYTASGDATIIANCSDPANPANGGTAVPTTYEQINPQLLARFGGNANLTPEEADTFTLGVVWSPEFIPDFSITVDWYRIDLSNAITTLSTQEILDSCYLESTPGTPHANCFLIDRQGTTGVINEVVNVFQNIGGIKVEGFDLGWEYTLPWREYGQFRWLVDTSYLQKYEDTVGGVTTERQGKQFGDFAFPRLRANSAVAWTLGPWGVNWGMRYVHSTTESCSDFLDGTANSLAALGVCSQPDLVVNSNSRNKLDATLYHNLQGVYNWQEQSVTVTLGVNNVLNEDPPVCTSCFANSYDPTLYEIPGRFGYVRLTKSF
jgi:iron complex outermembrane recepter protein